MTDSEHEHHDPFASLHAFATVFAENVTAALEALSDCLISNPQFLALFPDDSRPTKAERRRAKRHLALQRRLDPGADQLGVAATARLHRAHTGTGIDGPAATA